MLELGNLINLKHIQLSKEEKHLKEQLHIFKKRYPKIADLIIPFLHWNETERKTFCEVFNSKLNDGFEKSVKAHYLKI